MVFDVISLKYFRVYVLIAPKARTGDRIGTCATEKEWEEIASLKSEVCRQSVHYERYRLVNFLIVFFIKTAVNVKNLLFYF